MIPVPVALLLVLAPKPIDIDLAGLAKAPDPWAVVSGRYDTDRGSLLRTYPNPGDPARYPRLRRFYAGWLHALTPFGKDGETLKLRILGHVAESDAAAAARVAAGPLVPFAEGLAKLDAARRKFDPLDAAAAADTLHAGLLQVSAAREKLKVGAAVNGAALSRPNLEAAAGVATAVRDGLSDWNRFYTGYDPLFNWWVPVPYKALDKALGDYIDDLESAARKLDRVKSYTPTPSIVPAPDGDVPDLKALLAAPRSEFAPVLQRYGSARFDRGRGGIAVPAGWKYALSKIDFEKLSPPARVDYLLLRNTVEKEFARFAAPLPPTPPRPVDGSGIPGRPAGRESLIRDLRADMIAYSPEEIMAAADREYAWCRKELAKATAEMGFKDDWRAAVEKVKGKHVRPGEQPKLIRDLERESEAYLDAAGLVTVAPMAKETWRMAMMSAEAQRTSPYFTGGEVITVAFPTDAMPHAAKLQSLRSNNIHFARATVHHELIPGHGLQAYMTPRYNTHRGGFGSNVWTEGWAFYWEMVLYERGDFAKTPEDRVGFLCWRMHRCARVKFSFGFHLGQLTPQQCVDLLVRDVGFEPESAAAEVRRSFAGGYPPLYQAGYILGAWQFWALRQEFVTAGKMTDREFHDRILKEGRLPLALVRAALQSDPVAPSATDGWKFLP